ncbi:MAG: transcription-repair coupling factor [Nitrospirota bacterium]
MSEAKASSPVFGKAVLAAGRGEEKIRISGLWGSSKALFLWELASTRQERPLLVISPSPKEAKSLCADYNFLSAGLGGQGGEAARAVFYPPWDVLPYDVIEPDAAMVAERLKVLKGVLGGTLKVVFTTVNAFMQRLPKPSFLLSEKSVIRLVKGIEHPLEAVVERLVLAGYKNSPMVYEPGEFSVRGGILDVYPPDMDSPVRIEFFGDMVESIRTFDPETQRSIAETESVALLPAKETGAGGETLPASIADYFGGKPLVVIDEPGRAMSIARDFEARIFSSYEASKDEGKPRPESLYFTEDGLTDCLEALRAIEIQSLPLEELPGRGSFNLGTRSIEGLRLRDVAPEPWPEDVPKTPVSIFCMNLKGLMKGRAVNIVSSTRGQAERLGEIFAEFGIPAVPGPPVLYPLPDGAVRISVGALESGFLIDDPGLIFITAVEIFGEKPKGAPAPRAKVERFLTSLSELSAGDYVVHVDHGIGRYLGLRRLTLLGVEADFLELVYSASDKLYVPVDELGKVQKYIGAEAASPSLDKLGGVAWERAKARAKKAVQEMAKELLELYAARSVAPGFAYSPDDHLFRELEASFEYEETPDQATAIAEVKADLEAPHPMDRLVCGDVGYGKTEVAVRAAFKVVLDGKQVAVLVPTTLLANQHFQTFSSRLAAFPVRVEVLSRFTPPGKIKEIIGGMKDGTVDIVIGTHRLLQKDVAFRDLGLLVVDEEHRFGVSHKEKLKRMRSQVDVLTLTATPIPRTLNMSISGIRDLSIIETPPPDRQPIKTIVTRFDKAAVKEAVLRELARGGQVFFVHNRIESIFSIGEMLKGLLPEARIAVAHGRMHESALEEVMRKFISGESDLLLTTAIIESGLDIPSANTIIINRADRFGLADLYQLRGRVGRSRTRAYAYLLVPGEDVLTETARARLRVLSELSELGAGFRLALHDLEIRGAGNILGAEQSGHIAAVGFELYTRLLEQAVAELKGEEAEETVDPAMDLKISAYIPDSYVPDTAHRLGIYKRLAGAGSGEEVFDLAAELGDRYGPLPEPARKLVQVMELKVLAKELKAGGIQLLPSEVKVTFTSRVNIPPDRLIGVISGSRGKIRYVPEYTLFIKRPQGDWEALYNEIKNSLKALAGI